MINTGEEYTIDESTNRVLEEIAQGFEYYLPDEKISQVWQETELISTAYPEFEAVYFERELENGKLYLSLDLEFFPVFIMWQATQLGYPTKILEGTFPGSDIIDLLEGSYVLVVGFSNPDGISKMEKALPPISDPENLTMDAIEDFAEPYLEELL